MAIYDVPVAFWDFPAVFLFLCFRWGMRDMCTNVFLLTRPILSTWELSSRMFSQDKNFMTLLRLLRKADCVNPKKERRDFRNRQPEWFLIVARPQHLNYLSSKGDFSPRQRKLYDGTDVVKILSQRFCVFQDQANPHVACTVNETQLDSGANL